MSTDDQSALEYIFIQSVSKDIELNATTIPLPKAVNLGSSPNQIADNFGHLEITGSHGKMKRLIVSPDNLPTSNPEIVQNDFHIVDIASADEAMEYLNPDQGTKSYTEVRKVTMKSNDVTKAIPVYQDTPPTLIKAIMMPSLDPDDVFSLIGEQNPTINTTNWKCYHHTKTINGKPVWTIGVEDCSIPVLKDIDFRPYVGSKRIKIDILK